MFSADAASPVTITPMIHPMTAIDIFDS